MNFNNFTIKAQEAVQEAVNLVQSRGQQAIEPVHVLQSVMKVGENVTNFIFQKLGMNGQQIALVLDKQIDSLPKVSGGEPYLSRETNEVFQKATQYSKEMGDEFVSLEPVLLALLNVKSTASTILKDAGMTERELREAITYLRNEWNAVVDIFNYGDTCLDNNMVERMNRYISLSRKNSLFFGSHKGAERGAILYTIALTCRMHKVNLFDYLTDVINRTAGWQPNTPLEKYRELLPDRWKKADE